MEKYFLKKHIKEVEPGFKISSIKDYYITYDQMLNIINNSDNNNMKSLYYNTCNFNQAKTLSLFLKKLYEKFGDRLLIDSEGKETIKLYNRSNNNISNDYILNFNSKYYNGNYITFSIDNYIYYLQFDKNPFFSESSYIMSKKIYQFDDTVIYTNLTNKYFIKEYYAGAKEEFNINDYIVDLYSNCCDCDQSALNLFNYFMEKCYKNESLRYRGNKERIYIINNNKYDSIYYVNGNENF